MTDTERNELVEKMTGEECPLSDWDSDWVDMCILHIESLGYEIVKKEHLDCLILKLNQMEQIADMALRVGKAAIDRI